MIVRRIRWKLVNAVLQTSGIAAASTWFAVARDDVGLACAAVFFASLALLGISKRPWSPRPLLSLTDAGITTGWGGVPIPWEDITSATIGKSPSPGQIFPRSTALLIEVADDWRYLSTLAAPERLLARVGRAMFPAAPLLVIQQKKTRVPLGRILTEMRLRAGRDLSQG